MRSKLRSLSLRLMLITCAAIIPLNLLLFVFSLNYLTEMERNLENTFQWDLDQISTRFDYSVANLEEGFLQLREDLKQEILELEQGAVTGLNQRRLWQELRRIRNSTGYFSVGFMRVQSEGFARITADAVEYDSEKQNQLKTALYGAELPDARYNAATVFRVDDVPYLLWSSASGQLTYGFLIPTDALMRSVTEPLYQGEELHLLDEQGRFLAAEAPEGGTGKWIEARRDIMNGKFIALRRVQRDALYSHFGFLQAAIVGILAVTILIVPLLLLFIRHQVVRPLHQLQQAMQAFGSGTPDAAALPAAATNEFTFVNQSFNTMMQEISRLKIEGYEKEIERLQIEAVNLRLQVNPHFLLNSLNLIHNLSLSKNNRAIQEFSRYLADYFRYALQQGDRLVPLSKEMDVAQRYLNAQAIRFPNAFQCDFSISPDMEGFLIPPLLVQNFLENALKYALMATRTLHIMVEAHADAGARKIVITDDGAGMPQATLQTIRREEPVVDKMGTHIGIWNCRKRLEMFYPNATIEITSTELRGTRVAITIPQGKGDADETAHG